MPLQGITIGTSPGGAISGGVAVPDVVGEQRAQAEARLEAFGFKVVAEIVEADGTEGEVYAQDPVAPAIKPRGAVVKIYVIKNPVEAPDFGERFDAIDQAIVDLETSLEDNAGARHAETMDKLQEISDKLPAGGSGGVAAP